MWKPNKYALIARISEVISIGDYADRATAADILRNGAHHDDFMRVPTTESNEVERCRQYKTGTVISVSTRKQLPPFYPAAMYPRIPMTVTA